jgi:hypothetical protein
VGRRFDRAHFMLDYVSTGGAGLLKYRMIGDLMTGTGLIDFRHFAEECRRLSSQVGPVDDKSILLDMAQWWIRLADREHQVKALLDEDGI